MPNWVEGKLKIRGKLEDIRRWVEECLHCYTTNWLGDGAHTELVKGAVRFEHDPDSEEMYLYVDKSAHIEGTRRNFIEKGEYVDFCEEGKKSISAFERMLDARKAKGLPCDWQTGTDVFRWWMEDDNINGQLSMDDLMEEEQ